MSRPLLWIALFAACVAAQGQSVQIADDAGLRKALDAAKPGARIVLAEGKYGPGVYVAGLKGTADAPIVIEAADAKDKPVFEGGKLGLHFSSCAHLTLRNVIVRGQSGNGLNFDDGGKADAPAHHIMLEGIDVADIGPKGNLDGIKLSGVDDLLVRNCTVAGWGGEAIDMVGCHRALIDACAFRGKAGYSQATGVQAKGASSEVTIRNCTFVDGGGRAVNLGGHTGAPFFRPLGAKYEARDVVVEGCRFAGSHVPFAFVGVDGAVARYNTIYHPEKWAVRILQENVDEGMVACRNGRVERNLFVFQRAAVASPVSIGPRTEAGTFTFKENWWYCDDRPANSRPETPSREVDGVYGKDPRVTVAKDGAPAAPTAAEAKAYGADALPAPAAAPAQRKKLAGLIADWFYNSHPDVLLTRTFETYTRDGKGLASQLELASVFRDLPTDKDLSGKYAAKHGFRVARTAEEALTLGTGKLAVDGVIICTEWAPYPMSDTGQFVYPHRRLFDDCVKVFKASGRVVPIFVDKHLADTWADSKYIYDTAREMKIPLMAGSSIPLCLLAEGNATVELGAEVKEIVGVSYHTLTTYGFHGVEMIQALAERRKGGETGIKRVRCLTGQAVWDAAGTHYDPKLLDAAIEKVGSRVPKGKTLRQATEEPTLFVVEYADGLRATLFTLNGAVAGWSAAWRYSDGRMAAELMSNEVRQGLARFDWQMKGVEDMIVTGKPQWPVERTLLSSGTLDAALISKRDGGKVIDTPYLMVPYAADDAWWPPEALRSKALVK